MSDKLKYLGYTGTVEYSAEDKCFYGKVEGMSKDVITYEGSSAEELENDFKAGVDAYLETCKAKGKEPRKPYSGQLNVRIQPALHELIADYAALSGSTINSVINFALGEFSKADRDKVVRTLKKAH